MQWIKIVAIAGLVTLVPAAEGWAQTQRGPGGVVSAQAGGFRALTDLNEAGTADFENGYNVGADAGYRFNPYVALRGTFAFARANSRGVFVFPAVVGVDADASFNRYFYGADVQVSAPLGGGSVRPYAIGGAGAVTIRGDEELGVETFTRPAGKVGAGVAFALPGTRASVHIEGTGWIYRWDELGFDKTQVDTLYSAGLTYRF